jgi:hypothetical protein
LISGDSWKIRAAELGYSPKRYGVSGVSEDSAFSAKKSFSRCRGS